jgi:hypothetical protein
MVLIPAMGYETVINFNWRELLEWHTTAIQIAKELRGVE